MINCVAETQIDCLREKVSRANKQYQDTIAAGYDSDSRNKFGVMHRNSQLRIRRYLEGFDESCREGVFIDLGCGTGNLVRIAKDIFKKVAAADISLEMLKVASRFTGNLLVLDANNLPFKDNSIKVIGASAFLHHFADHGRLFKEVYRCLKKDGIFFSDYEPNFYSLKIMKGSFFLRPIWRLHNFIGNLMLRLSSKRQIDKEIEMLADYYSDIGLKKEDLIEEAKRANFKEIDVFAHLDPEDFKKPANGRFMHKFYSMMLKIFSPSSDFNKRAKLLCLIVKK